MHIVLRTNLPASALAPTLEQAVRGINSSVPIVGLRDMDAVFDDSIGRPRLLAQLLGAFAGLALLLAVLGTYGVLSFMVAERQREIGIRVAIGATRGNIVSLVTRQGLAIVSIGLAIGLAGALGLARLLGSLLFRRRATDPTTVARRHDHDCDRCRTGVRAPGLARLSARPERRSSEAEETCRREQRERQRTFALFQAIRALLLPSRCAPLRQDLRMRSDTALRSAADMGCCDQASCGAWSRSLSAAGLQLAHAPEFGKRPVRVMRSRSAMSSNGHERPRAPTREVQPALSALPHVPPAGFLTRKPEISSLHPTPAETSDPHRR